MKEKDWVYLDNNATTALHPDVIKIMHKEDLEGPCNPSSLHFFGQKAKAKLSQARKQIADLFHVPSQEILFTSGGSESVNWSIRGFFNFHPKGHVITTNVEHACIFETLKVLEKQGLKVSYLPAGPCGAVQPKQIEEAVTQDTKLIVLASVNSVTGVKTNIEEIAQIAKKHNIHLVVDAVAQVGKEPIQIFDGISAMCFSAHKFHGPKGIGCAYLSSYFPLSPLITGGTQEFQKRAGTENLTGILGLAKALEIVCTKPKTTFMQELRDLFEKTLFDNLDGIHINGEGPRICNTSNLFFEDVDGETLLILLDQAKISASLGSACASGGIEPSRALLNMGFDPKRATSSIRFSFSRMNTKRQIEIACKKITHLIQKIRSV